MSLLATLTRFRREPAPPSRFVALDFDHRHLRVVSAETQGDVPKFRKLVTVDLPAELNLSDASALGAFIGQSLRDLRMDGLPVLMDVPRRQAVLKPLTLPTVEDERELPGMVRYQVESELPFAIDEAVIDFTIESHAKVPQPASTTKGAPPQTGAKQTATAPDAEATQPILVAAVRRSVVEHYQQVAEAANVKLFALGLRPYADARCLAACLPMELRQETLALIHIAGDEAEINVVVGGLLAFSRSAAVKQEAMPHGAAPDTHAAPSDTATNTSPGATDTLVVEVMRTLQSAAAVQGGLTIDRIYVAGDTAMDQPLADALAKRLNLPCEVLSPIESLKIKKAKTDGRGFITAIGLAIGHGDGGRMPFNFINPKRPPVERDIRKLRIMTGAAAAALILLTAVIVGIVQRVSASSELSRLQATYNTLDKENSPVQKLRQRVKAIDDWRNESRTWLDHWAQVTALFPGSKDAYVANMRSAGDDSIAINLRARTPDIITDLAKRLRAAGYDVQVGKQTFVTDPFNYGYDTLLTLSIDRKMKVDVANLRAEPRPEDDIGLQLIRRSESRSFGSSRSSSEDRDGDTRTATPDANPSATPPATKPEDKRDDNSSTKPQPSSTSTERAQETRPSSDPRDASRSRFDRRR